ncbi:hypothetical protein NC653_031070 [Populus alba x Populus x berolinensis]|uniref:Uncharacterized protein n=1 Tax=Populus alba x Populus x berolinensis TaxID=444605 RepID=A0AAD6Q134_9ROSI|nr:hypothetical protein NC653_031070 [Populus alba x Populus x berolinensis]
MEELGMSPLSLDRPPATDVSSTAQPLKSQNHLQTLHWITINTVGDSVFECFFLISLSKPLNHLVGEVSLECVYLVKLYPKTGVNCGGIIFCEWKICLTFLSSRSSTLMARNMTKGKQPSKDDKFEYVTHRKLYKIDKEGSGADFKLYVPYL